MSHPNDAARSVPLAPQAARTRLLESPIALVEDLRSCGVRQADREDYSPAFQVCLPYRGLFVWHVGHDHVVSDANQILFVTGGESFRLSQSRASGYAELILTPDPQLLIDLADGSGAALNFHPLFRRRSRHADPDLQRRRACFLHHAIRGDWDGVEGEEAVVDLLRASLASEEAPAGASRVTTRLVGRAKEFLEAHLASPVRLLDVSRAIGVSPAYLTDAFRRVEGVPLHRYLVRLRLARALVEAPHAEDLTTLAFSLGFSSHSHFTAQFRRAFGVTPSQYRQSSRAAVRRPAVS